ncbi:MAG: hypothetical protein KNU04_gp59 [crAssphage sp. isolate ctbg_1]|uniref:Uncharacterized protein n=1 Tax=crAssphage sp. isolate ctbg_1 TaxID=2989854 RepID=A0A345MT22_9CAUD|nr:MAG: hypothetical protein KNU04_gp59 [crAssphage sp. isolate ctbg_1]AXH74522.1 MAG: hypothetical protein [crAssphage sp. isolate ctbg_1]
MVKVREVSYLGNSKRTMLFRFNERGTANNQCIMLESISEEEEQFIDVNNYWVRKKGGKDIEIPKYDIMFYGEVNVNNEDDITLICKKNLVDENLRHSWVPSNFNYRFGTGLAHSCAPTADPVLWFKYCHVRIGKPQRVIAYKIKETLAS